MCIAMRMSSTSSRRRSKGNSKAKPVLAAGSRRVPSSTSNKNVLREKKKQCNQQNSTTFPFKLYEMLQHAQDSEFSSSISWLPNGSAFIIHDADVLMRNLAPMFFQQTKFRSFVSVLLRILPYCPGDSHTRIAVYYHSFTHPHELSLHLSITAHLFRRGN